MSNVNQDGTGQIGVWEDRSDNGFFALIIGQGDGEHSPKHHYKWRRIYYNGVDCKWLLMDRGPSATELDFVGSYYDDANNTHIAQPAIEQNKNTSVPCDTNTDGYANYTNYNGAIVWIETTFLFDKIEYGFVWQPILKFGKVYIGSPGARPPEGADYVQLVPVKDYNDPTPNGQPLITCYIYSYYNRVEPVFTDLRSDDILAYIQINNVPLGFLMPIKPVVLKWGKLTADWVVDNIFVNITPIRDRDDITPTGEANRDVFLFTPEALGNTIAGINLTADDVVCYIPVQTTGYVVGTYFGHRVKDCNENIIVEHAHIWKFLSGFEITKDTGDIHNDTVKVALNIEIKSSDNFVDIAHTSVNSNGTYCKEVWDITCSYPESTNVTYGPFVQFANNCIQTRNLTRFLCNESVVYTNWTNVLCFAPCNAT